MRNFNPKVTVIIPVYNGEQFLRTSIESILNQTYGNFNVLVIDDGSTDNSQEIIKMYHDPRIKVLTNEKNQGLVFSLNRGLDCSDGDYAARMDCDDFSLPTRLEKQVEFMESNPDVGVCGTWYSVYDESLSNEMYTANLAVNPEEIRTVLFFCCCLCHPSTMLRLSYFNKFQLRYNKSDLHAEDYGLWVRCSRLFQLANIPEVLLHYRLSPKGICYTHRSEQMASTGRILIENLKNLGIQRSDNEFLRLHCKIILGKDKLGGSADKIRIREWFNKLREANKTTGYYPEREFTDLLKMSIFQVCDCF